MTKLLTSTILCLWIVYAYPQRNITLKNRYDNKIQVYAGANFLDFFGPDRHCIGMELSKSLINIVVMRSVDIDYGFSFFGPTHYKNGYEKNIVYSGIRIRNKFFSSSLNFGIGSITRYNTIEKESDYIDEFGNSRVQKYTAIKNQSKPCAEILLKLDLTARANGIGFIMATNFNSKNVFFDARLVFQFGYAWNRSTHSIH